MKARKARQKRKPLKMQRHEGTKAHRHVKVHENVRHVGHEGTRGT